MTAARRVGGLTPFNDKDGISRKYVAGSDPSSERCKLFWIALFALLAAIVFSPVLNIPFYYDDYGFIVENPTIKHLSNIKDYFTKADSISHLGSFWIWRPMRTLSYAIDYHLWGLNAAAFHLVGVMLHIIAGVLVYLLLRCLKRGRVVAGLCSAIFLFHPIQTQAVAWVSCRGDLLAGVSVLAVLFLALKAAQQGKEGQLLKRISYLAFIMGLLSKESAVMAPVVLLLCLEYHKDHLVKELQRLSRRVYWMLPYLILVVLYLVLRWLILGQFSQPVFSVEGDPVPGIAAMPLVYARYASLVLLPWPLKLEYPPQVYIGNLEWWGSVVVTIGLFAGAVIYFKKRPGVSLGLAWFLLFLLPVSHIVSFHGLMSEHALYISIIGMLIAFSSVEVKRRKIVWSLMALLCVAFAVISLGRFKQWQHPIEFWEREIRLSPQSYRAPVILGNEYHRLGDLDSAKRAYCRALALRPADKEAALNLARIDIERGDLINAKNRIEKILQSHKQDPDVFTALGYWYLRSGLFKEASKQFQQALMQRPNDPVIYAYLGMSLDQAGLYQEALKALHTAIYLNQDASWVYNNLGIVYAKIGETEQARIYWKKALKLDPDFTEAQENLSRSMLP